MRKGNCKSGYLLSRSARLRKTIHEVGADPKLYEVEHNLTSNDVTEQVIKGNVAIIKHTDDGETKIETPEKGASFEIYLKSAGSYDAANKDERDTIVCDENGFGQTKDMPYGIYTVHQTSGWEGREMMDDFDVFISQNAQTYRYLINNRNFESFVNVIKVDAESGKSIPYAGAGFKIYDPQGNQVKMTFTCIVFCDRYGKDLRKFYRCEETGTRFKTLCPFCIGERCYHIRNGAYACII